jgi:hypothetical protein
MTFNANQTSGESGQNELYLKMRSRFDFSGNRTIGEFMMAKAASEGYSPVRAKKKSGAGIRKLSRRHPVASAFALLISCALFLFCTIRFMDDVSTKEYVASSGSGDSVSISINTVTDPAAVQIVFPQGQQIDTTME